MRPRAALGRRWDKFNHAGGAESFCHIEHSRKGMELFQREQTQGSRGGEGGEREGRRGEERDEGRMVT